MEVSNFQCFLDLAEINTSDISINDIKKNLPAGVSLPPEFESVSLPSVDDAAKLFKDKCIKVSGSDASYEEASVISIY
jgi:hypothetical protein